jgi:hypothetical protein
MRSLVVVTRFPVLFGTPNLELLLLHEGDHAFHPVQQNECHCRMLTRKIPLFAL